METGKLTALEDILLKTPQGVVELLNIKGIGPKKIHAIWKEMEIESVGELLYACQENRLKLYKGFGEKTQQSLIETIEFYQNNKGSFLFAQIEVVEPQITAHLKKLFGNDKAFVTGGFKRQLEYLDELEYVVALNNEEIV